MEKCTWLGTVSGDWVYSKRRTGKRETESVAVMCDGGRRATMWVPPHHPPARRSKLRW